MATPLTDALRRVLRDSGPVDRRTYVTAGTTLVAAKYAIDAAVIYAVAGVVWTPLDYVFPLVSIGNAKTTVFPAALSLALLIWTLPFIWIGVMMSARRAQDAGIPIWIVGAFFLPILNHLLLLVLAVAPRARAATAGLDLRGGAGERLSESARNAEQPGRWFHTTDLLAALAGTSAAVATTAIVTVWVRSYGLAVFFGVPFLLGLVSGYVANVFRPHSTGQTMAVVCLAMFFTTIGIIMVALEGAICLALAFPITVPVALMGGAVAQGMANFRGLDASGAGMALALVMIPAGGLIERAIEAPAVRVVMTSVEVDAVPSRVWRHVVVFDEITEPPGGAFRLGLAYPLRARIEGTGPGALRYCEFSTGAFVEPITAWEEASRLAFDVTEQPAPLQEWSPYSRVYAPHLKGFFRATHGEFRLVSLAGGRTRLEGRTWYSLNMAPAIYWNPIADVILHRIHDRVLLHIKARTEEAQS
jgi:hypothetical protein